MAEKIEKTLIRKGVSMPSFNAPIPGESLTASPETPTAWEQPPLYTDEDKAMEELYLVLTEQNTLKELVRNYC